jgi:hypothetical protein
VITTSRQWLISPTTASPTGNGFRIAGQTLVDRPFESSLAASGARNMPHPMLLPGGLGEGGDVPSPGSTFASAQGTPASRIQVDA